MASAAAVEWFGGLRGRGAVRNAIRYRFSQINPLPTPGFSAREQSARPSLRPGTAPRPLGLRGRPRAHLDRTRPRYNRPRVTEV